MQRVLLLVSAVAFVVFALLMARLGAQEAGGPTHASFELALPDTAGLRGGLPATLFLAGAHASADGRIPNDSPPPGERRPAIVLMHGFASDRHSTSTLARSLATAGYAVLAVDIAGHGSNRNPFAPAGGGDAQFDTELATAVAWLRRSSYVDGSRIAMVGHSMGASASLAYASRDVAIDAAVMISSGRRIPGPHRPANALFIYAEDDPERIHLRSAQLTARLAGVDAAEPGRIYGRFEDGTAVQHRIVPDVDHLTIMYSSEAVAEIVAWLDAAFGTQREQRAALSDPRLSTTLLGLLALLLVLPGLGLVTGAVAASAERDDTGGIPYVGFLVWFAMLTIAAMIVAPGAPLPALGLVVGDLVIPLLGLAGLLSLALAARLHLIDLSELRKGWPQSLAAAGLAVLGLIVLLTPLAVALHSTTLTPERWQAALLSALVLVPFGLALNALLRRGSLVRATACAIVGRAAVIALLIGATKLGVLPGVVMLMVGALAGVQVLLEVVSSAMYAAGARSAAIGLVDALAFAWVLALVLPMNL